MEVAEWLLLLERAFISQEMSECWDLACLSMIPGSNYDFEYIGMLNGTIWECSPVWIRIQGYFSRPPTKHAAAVISINGATFSSGCGIVGIVFRCRGRRSLGRCTSASKCSKLFLLSELSVQCFVFHQLAWLNVIWCYSVFLLMEK